MENFTKTWINSPGLPEPGKVYVLGVSSKGFIPDKIKELSPSNVISEEDRYSHVAYLKDNEVIESHFKSKGVVKYSFCDWLKANQKQGTVIKAFEYQFLVWDKLEVYAHLMVPYGALDILAIYKEARFRFGDWHFYAKPYRDSSGVHCSELGAECDRGHICKWSGLEDWEVKPVTWQDYAYLNGFEVAELTGVNSG